MAIEKWLLHSPGESAALELTSDIHWYVQVKDGVLKAPAFAGEDGQRQGHGMQWRQKGFGPSSATLQMIISDRGAGAGGVDPQAWEKQHEKIVRHSSWPYGPIRLQRFPDATKTGGRWAYVERSSPVTPATMGVHAASYEVEYNIPSGCWYDNAQSEWTGGASGTSQMTQFAGATFPCTNIVVELTGTPAGIQIATVAGWLRVNQAVPAGTTVTLNCETGEITAGWSKHVQYSGYTYLEIPPQSAAPSITITGGGGTVKVKGYKSYQNS